MPANPIIFDPKRVNAHRKRAAKHFSAHDFLFREAAGRLAERLEDIPRDYSDVLDLSGHEFFDQAACRMHPRNWTMTFDFCLRRGDEHLPFAENRFDLVVSAGGLHWVNDLPGFFIQIRKCLKPGGLFLAIMPGGETLKELRQSFEQAEMKISGGVSPRVSPFIDVRDAAGLLQRAGFQMPVADSDVLTVEYEHPLKLLHDLRGMGETNALLESCKYFTGRRVMEEMVKHYAAHFSGDEGRVVASFELVTLTGLKPS